MKHILTTLFALGAFSVVSAAQQTRQTVDNNASSPDVEYVADERQTLESFEVTAMRFGDGVFDTPVNAQNISAQTIDQSGLVSVPDVLRRYADVYVRNTGSSPNTGELSMRGFGENSGQRVLVLVDGQRLNTLDLSFTNWAQVPLEEIENIEVLRGPQTAAYGNYAEGGVVKISTKRWGQPDNARIGGFFGTYGEYCAYARAASSNDDYYAGANANYYHNSGYLENSLSWAKSAGASAGAKLDTKNELHFNASGGNEYFSWANPLSSLSLLEQNPTVDTGVSQTNNMAFATFSGAWENRSDFGEGALNFGMNMRDCDTVFPASGYGSSNGVVLWTASFTPRYRVYFDGADSGYAEGGFDFYRDDMQSKRYGDESYLMRTAKTDIVRTTAAPWLGGRYALDETFSISATGRYEYAKNNCDCHSVSNSYDESSSFGGLAAQLGLNVKIDESFNIYFRFDQIYRYPAIDEMASYWGTVWTLDTFNADLKPERGQNYEIGANFARDRWRANLSLFFASLDDEIMCDPATWKNINIGSTNRFGADVKLGYELESVGVSTSWTFVSAKFDGGEYGGNSVPLVPTMVSSTRAWVKPVEFCRLELEYQWTSAQKMGSDFYNSQSDMPAFWTVNLTANFFICKNVRAFVALNNMTDEAYATYASFYASAYGNSESWYPALGRSVRVGMEIKF